MYHPTERRLVGDQLRLDFPQDSLFDVALDEVDDVLEHFVGMRRAVADAHDPQCRHALIVEIFNFSNPGVELISHALGD